MHVSNTHLYSPNSACAWGFLLCLRVGSPLAKTCSLPICFEIQHCSSPGCLSHGVQIEKDALSTAASHEAPVHKRARQDCKQKRIFSTGASREAPVDKRLPVTGLFFECGGLFINMIQFNVRIFFGAGLRRQTFKYFT